MADKVYHTHGSELVQACDDWMQGFQKYCDGSSVQECQNPQQERGWWAALDAQVAAEMPASEEPGYDYATIHGPNWA